MPPPPAMSDTTSLPATKQRSCITCRHRKVRCDKLSPCSNCRRASIPCVLPSIDRPPRWARRLRQEQHHQQHRQCKTHIDGAEVGCLPPDASPSPNFPASTAALQGHAWAEAAPGVPLNLGAILDRLTNLEALVGKLGSSSAALPATQSVASAASASLAQTGLGRQISKAADATIPDQVASVAIQEKFGRLILDDDSPSRSRYVSSGFWSKINDELDELREGTEELADDYSSENGSDLDEVPDQAWPVDTRESSKNDQRTSVGRSTFLFGHNLCSVSGNLPDYRPLPSQIPFLFQVYVTNVNVLCQVIHVPTTNKLIEGMLRDTDNKELLTPENEALMFAIYYAAVESMEEEDVFKNFASSKVELRLKYRLGLELSLAKTDFLNTPDIVLVQAFLIFLMLVRRNDSPRFVWMMTGLAIRMGQSLGLQRDGSNFDKSLTPFETEIRRRVWWTICAIDVRSSEDQGTDLTILPGSFDTRLPLNINDDDIGPDTMETPKERHALTDSTFSIMSFEMCRLTQRMMALAASASKQYSHDTGQPVGPGRDTEMPPMSQTRLLEEQGRMLDEVYQKLNSIYLQYSPDTSSITYWTGLTITRMVMAKMTLILYLPLLIGEQEKNEKKQRQLDAGGGEELRSRLLTSAIEVAEYNHALNAERACRHWKWLYETYTQWHAIAFLLMETARRPWDPAVERAWVSLHSPYLIPPHFLRTGKTHQGSRATNVRMGSARTRSNSSTKAHTQLFWLPLRKLLSRSRRHRAAELERLRSDVRAARYLEVRYDVDVAEGRSRPLSNPASVELFRNRWRRLIYLDNCSTPSTSSSLPVTTSAPHTSKSSAATPAVAPVATMTNSTETGNLGNLAELSVAGQNPVAGKPGSFTEFAFHANTVPMVPCQSQTQPLQPPQPPLPSPPFPTCSSGSRGLHSNLPDSSNNHDSWRIWTGLEANDSVFGGSQIVNDMAPMIDEDLDADMDGEAEVNWGTWFASIKDFERDGTFL